MKSSWQPRASIEMLQQRGALLHRIRQFFADRNVLEVETPLLGNHAVTDPYLHSLTTHFGNKPMYLQTSPEYCMKRLLAAGSGSIYQISKAFRDDEVGKNHNPEFTLLEWYQVNYNHFDLMNEVDDFLQWILTTPAAEKISYQALFKKHLDIDPLAATNQQLINCCQHFNIILPSDIQADRDLLLQCLMSDYIEPRIGQENPTIVYHYPASQAALARINNEDPRVADRFEVYYQGIELANGFHELCCKDQQKKRFEKNNLQRQQLGLPILEIDNFFLDALTHGLPDCAGVALGIDRLVMLASQKSAIGDVMSFTIHNS